MRIFEKFAQTDEMGMRSEGGTGLAVPGRRAAMGRPWGVISFVLVVDESTTFNFELPLAVTRSQDEESVA